MTVRYPKRATKYVLLAFGGMLVASAAQAQTITAVSADAAEAAHAMMRMPSFEESAIPSGSAGAPELRVRPTQDQPSPGMDGAFRTVCEFSHMNQDDPIVYPDQEGAAHLHAYFGNTEADAFSTAESLKTTGNSTCRGGIANRSGYWVPALIDQHGTPQTPTALHVYYKTGWHGVRPADVQPFPDGLRMIAGDAKATAAQSHAHWECLNEGQPSASIPNCQPGEILGMVVEFPQCWDGKNLDSDDHKSHMAYPDNGCPASHPVPIPAITYRTEYLVPAEGIGDWRIASDMYDPNLPGGYSAHADWFEGWDPEVAKAFVTQCLNRQLDCHSHLLGDGREVYY